jgi:CheY-like chemotaxis protein
MQSRILENAAALREHDGAITPEPRSSGEYRIARAAPEQHSEPLHGTERVLLAEDDPGVRRTTLQVLNALGYQVQAFASGPELLANVGRHSDPSDLLLTDFEMPGLTGYELALRLRALQPNLKILLTSGLPEEDIVPAVRPVDWPHFIGKPFTLRSLGTKLRELLDELPLAGRSGVHGIRSALP